MDMVVTPLAGSFRYDVSITNDEVVDLALVTITDAPLADPLIDPTLTTPPGFLGSYDGGLGFVDFIEGATDNFGAGTTVGGFSFESLSDTGVFFTMFSALSVDGDPFSGSINVRTNAVPETGGAWSLASLAFLALAFAQRSFSTRGNIQPQAQT
jgi:hypothetical protein